MLVVEEIRVQGLVFNHVCKLKLVLSIDVASEMMKTESEKIPPCCPLTFQEEESTVDSYASCESDASSAARSGRVLLRVCSLFSCSPAVDQPLLTFQRSHGILIEAGSVGALPLQDSAVVSTGLLLLLP